MKMYTTPGHPGDIMREINIPPEIQAVLDHVSDYLGADREWDASTDHYFYRSFDVGHNRGWVYIDFNSMVVHVSYQKGGVGTGVAKSFDLDDPFCFDRLRSELGWV